jgi:hypothetical protein
MKLYNVITENLDLTDNQLKRVRSVHKALRTGITSFKLPTRKGTKEFNMRYELPMEHEAVTTVWNDLGVEFPVYVQNGKEEDADFPCKVWMMDPEQGEILVNDLLTGRDKKDILYGKNPTAYLDPRDVNMGDVYRLTLSAIYDKYSKFDIFVNMYPKEN